MTSAPLPLTTSQSSLDDRCPSSKLGRPTAAEWISVGQKFCSVSTPSLTLFDRRSENEADFSDIYYCEQAIQGAKFNQQEAMHLILLLSFLRASSIMYMLPRLLRVRSLRPSQQHHDASPHGCSLSQRRYHDWCNLTHDLCHMEDLASDRQN